MMQKPLEQCEFSEQEAFNYAVTVLTCLSVMENSATPGEMALQR